MRVHFIFEPDVPARFAELGLLAERLGFEAVWTANILSARDPFLAFSILAQRSQRLRMGPVAISPFELHPLKIANSLFALNELAGGRASIVIGGGGGTSIGMGLKPERTSVFPRMVRAVRECVEILRAASPDRPLDYQGEIYRVTGYRPEWLRDPRPLIYLAASRPQMLELACRVADGVMLSDISPSHLPQAMATIRAGLAAAGRPFEGYRINNLIAWHVKADRRAAYAEARRKLWVRGVWERARIAPYLSDSDCDLVQRSLPGWQKAYGEGSPTVPGVPERVLDAIVDGMTYTGNHADLDRIIERIVAMRDAGVNELGLRLYGEPERSMALVAERVVPALA
jgi:alkanesulfonate monooxygenase SsuD/methylene tetrahydromethanopterin reductase-like flavin-dependent oxidoreductase (luciferase family)